MSNRSLTLKCKQIDRHSSIQLQPNIDQLSASIAKTQGALPAQRVGSIEQARKQKQSAECPSTRRKTLTSSAKVQDVHDHFTKASISKAQKVLTEYRARPNEQARNQKQSAECTSVRRKTSTSRREAQRAQRHLNRAYTSTVRAQLSVGVSNRQNAR